MTDTYTSRKIDVEPYGYEQLQGYIATVILSEIEDTRHGGRVVSDDVVGKYAFQLVVGENIADSVRGELPDVESPAIYIGNSFGKYYYRSHALDDVPNDVLERVSEKVTLLENVDGGWASWSGRPEFDESRTYIDFSDAEVVELEGSE